MKKLLSLLILLYAGSCLMAQYCGHTGNPSGPGQCTATGLEQPGLAPYDSIDPFVNGEESTTIIQFQNFDTISFGGQILTIQWLRIDSLGNLPDGLCWTTNKPNNTFTTGEAGCVKISGTPCDGPGQYRLKIIVTPYIGVSLPVNPDESNGLKYFVRLKNTGDADTPIDTTQTMNNMFIPYGNPIAGCTPTGINEADALLTSLSISPNPFTGKATAQFFCNSNGIYTQSITNLLGNEVYQKETGIIQGENKLTIDAGNLSAGIYFYSISNGISKAVKRIVIE